MRSANVFKSVIGRNKMGKSINITRKVNTSKQALMKNGLGLVLLLLATTAAVKAGDYTYTTNSDNTLTITRYTGPGGDVVIPLTIDGRTVTIIGEDAFTSGMFTPNTNLTSVMIPDSITIIGEFAFFQCDSLTNVMIGNSVTSIGDRAFYSCNSLTSVTIPHSVISIGESAFYSCTSLTNVMIGHGLTSIGEIAFLRCQSLIAITVAEGNSAYSSLNGVLFNKSQTTLIQYPEGKFGSYTIPASVISIGDYAFTCCTNLTSITIPDSVTSIGYMTFDYCIILINVTIPDSVINIGDYAFYNCTGLTSVTIGNGTVSIGNYAFGICTSLTSVKIPDSVSIIGCLAFYACTSLLNITIPGSVIRIGTGAFLDCPSLLGIYFNGNAPDLGFDVFKFDDNATIYYLAGTTGWGPTFGGRPAMQWWDGPQISANGTREDVSLNSGDILKITVALDADNHSGALVDWWIVAHAGSEWYYLNNTGQWAQFISNCQPAYQGGLFNLPATEVLSKTDLPVGSYTFWFAIDYPMDGILNLGGYILIDSVNVIVQ